METWSYIGVATVIYVAYKFIMRLGKGLPILELMLLIAGLQWIIGPIIEYASPSTHWKYYMYVNEESYMSFVVPAYMLFCLVLFLTVLKKGSLNLNLEMLKNYSKYGLIIFLMGIIFELFGRALPRSLGFLVFIISNFKFVGAIILFYSENKKLKRVFYLAIIYLLLVAISKALFHDFILWSMFFYMFWSLKHKPSVRTILVTFVVGIFFALALQTIKAAFRLQVWNNYSGNKLELFVSLLVSSLTTEDTSAIESDDEIGVNVRLNQGWIISAIIDNIPMNQDYLNGATIKDAVFASILPRFLNPNKAKAGGQENFMLFTGLSINEGVSMGISIVGEAFGNFGRTGGVVFMGIWGFFIGRVWLFLKRMTKTNIVFVAFLPLIFLQVIKAETELVVVLNHLIKSIVVVILFFWFAKKQLRWRID
ncbi:hypothetical protein HNV08_12265 [Winogradskyella eckloniae]|uniref:hypothetical protein n=1 Tax=Winogradskyella eckloniae TaxID=1089306 RepID=UPI0015674933|nr:hypothetical protein [Winogradskyella eckloniae]NRD20822.1 hypothetical protein [Winogradskyella eckloniae]